MKSTKTTITEIPETAWLNNTREERIAYGKSLREKAPRTSHAKWPVSENRPDPVAILIKSSEGRQENLIPIRYGRMLQSPFSFFRGAASIMASDLSTTPVTGLYVQACGDCHLLNFGSYGTPERNILFDINDFDETLPAPWEWDIKRLAASFVIAALNNKLPESIARACAKECATSYKDFINNYASLDPLKIWYSSISAEDILKLSKDETVSKRYRRQIEKASNKNSSDDDFPKLAEIKDGKAVIKDNPPLIYHFTNVDMHADHKLLDKAFELYFSSLGTEKRTLLRNYHFQDFAAKVVGVGSVGTRCGISLRMTPDGDPLFLQVKEARDSVLEPYAGKSAYRNNGERVVIGQKLMQAATDIFLGWTKVENSGHFYIRQLRDLKIKPLVEIFDSETMVSYARLCGWTLARAHAKSGSSSIIKGYLGQSAVFAEAIADFAMAYSNQNKQDFEALKTAVRDGKIDAYFE